MGKVTLPRLDPGVRYTLAYQIAGVVLTGSFVLSRYGHISRPVARTGAALTDYVALVFTQSDGREVHLTVPGEYIALTGSTILVSDNPLVRARAV